jgi:hypothetical protein
MKYTGEHENDFTAHGYALHELQAEERDVANCPGRNAVLGR